MDSIAGLIPPIILVAIIILLVKRSRKANNKDTFLADISDTETSAIRANGSNSEYLEGDGIWKRFRDTTRDSMAQSLSVFGIKTELADRGRPEESIGISYGWVPGTNSLGIIDIEDGLITFINVIRTKSKNKNEPPRYKYVFCVPDKTIPMEHKALSIKTIRRKPFPIFGKVLGVEWQGANNLEPLVRLFSQDDEVNEFVTEFGDVNIKTHPNKFQGWTIETNKRNLTGDHWHTLQKIANHLISSRR